MNAHEQLLHLLHTQIIPQLVAGGNICVTYNRGNPAECEVRTVNHRNKRLSTYPVGTLHVGNPGIEYRAQITDKNVVGVLSRYPAVEL